MHHHITITTDAGRESVYVSAFKGILYRAFSEVVITEINTNIASRNIQQAAFSLQHSFTYFPAETLHIIDVDSSFVLYKRLLYTKHENQHFIALDNGVLSLVLPDVQTQVFEVVTSSIENQSRYEKFAFAAKHILNGTKTIEMFKPIANVVTFKHQLPGIIGNRITAQIIAIDNYGNCITNLHFDELNRHLRGRKVVIRLPMDIVFKGVMNSYYDVEDGECVCIKNNMGLLEIAIHNANASQLLGLHEKSSIIFEME
jgi:S-adenosylmethionine hydrolase